MSLKNFHLVFVTVCSLLFAFLILWSFILAEEASAMTGFMGYVGVLGMVLTIIYGVYFQRKARAIQI
jgi:cytochrome b